MKCIVMLCNTEENGKVSASMASERSETLSGMYKFEPVQYMHTYMYEDTSTIIVVHAMRIRNVGGVRPQPFFLYVPAILNIVTTGNRH